VADQLAYMHKSQGSVPSKNNQIFSLLYVPLNTSYDRNLITFWKLENKMAVGYESCI
jgi:hypothetical protein